MTTLAPEMAAKCATVEVAGLKNFGIAINDAVFSVAYNAASAEQFNAALPEAFQLSEMSIIIAKSFCASLIHVLS